MTSFNRCVALMLIMTVIISAAMTTTTTDYNNNNNDDDDIVMQRWQMLRERGNNNNNSSGDTTMPMTTTTTRGLTSHTTCQGDDCAASCTTSPNVPNATTLISNLLAVNKNNHENIQIVNVTTLSHMHVTNSLLQLIMDRYYYYHRMGGLL